jgi:hypothetical protein
MQIDSKHGRSYNLRLLKVYNLLHRDKFKYSWREDNWAKVCAYLKSLLKEYSEYELALLFIIHFNWYGADGAS